MTTTNLTRPVLLAHLAEQLSSRGLTLATAESCTGGLIAAQCTDLAGSSAWFNGGIVSYSNAMKIKLLGVDPLTLAEEGAVSAATAEQMALGAVICGDADIAISTTGIAGPGGGQPDKPVGTVWLASVVNGEVESVCKNFPGGRDEVRQATLDFALVWLINRLKSIS